MHFVGFMASVGEKMQKTLHFSPQNCIFKGILAAFPALFLIDFIENGLKRQTKGSKLMYFLFHVNSLIFYQDMFDFVEVVNSLKIRVFWVLAAETVMLRKMDFLFGKGPDLSTTHFYMPVEDGTYHGINHGRRASGRAGGVQFFVQSISPKLL